MQNGICNISNPKVQEERKYSQETKFQIKEISRQSYGAQNNMPKKQKNWASLRQPTENIINVVC